MSHILWIDLETTGLETKDCTILEVGAIVTDKNLREIAVYQGVIHRLEPEFRTMNEWCKKTHSKSGLLEECRWSLKCEGDVEREFRDFITDNFGSEKAIIAGSSVHFDKKFLDAKMPTVASKLHYRLIDVSSFKETFRIVYGYDVPNDKAPAHRALADIRGSIVEYKRYLEMIKVPA